ncbi:hypothetical protein LX64_01099 [Chitinophaga skermanii]|uniref:Integral membrane protein n=1 Tax=Chitinophaga skermanii TaxID=331697 RepID=A0A327QXC4_9BACT|nr:hypothetical protein [Chitinophaga skermanii]RAJ08448.1 hypothetical protein LX64_01099 [Chitinophaga skermanii]
MKPVHIGADFYLIAYLVYIPVVLVITWYVSHSLFKNGKIFMLDIFRGKQDIAFATNKLFETGFYLMNLGFAFATMRIYHYLDSNRALMESLSAKIGGFCIYLGAMLFLNLFFFFRGRKAAKLRMAEEARITNTVVRD